MGRRYLTTHQREEDGKVQVGVKIEQVTEKDKEDGLGISNEFSK